MTLKNPIIIEDTIGDKGQIQVLSLPSRLWPWHGGLSRFERTNRRTHLLGTPREINLEVPRIFAPTLGAMERQIDVIVGRPTLGGDIWSGYKAYAQAIIEKCSR